MMVGRDMTTSYYISMEGCATVSLACDADFADTNPINQPEIEREREGES